MGRTVMLMLLPAKSGKVYITGTTNSSKGMATANTYSTTYYGAPAGVTFIAKFDSRPVNRVQNIIPINASISLFPNPEKKKLMFHGHQVLASPSAGLRMTRG